MKNREALRAQHGFTIVEFMVAGLLGLILLGGTLQIFLGARQSISLQNGMVDVQDSGRMGLQFLSEDIQRAGWMVNMAGSLTERFTLGTDKTEDGCESNGLPGEPAADCLQVRYEGTVDCLGNTIVGTTVMNRYYVSYQSADPDDGVVVGDLMCLGNGNSVAQALVRNVENFQILYGFDTDGDKVANRYVTAASLTNTNMNQVVSIRVAFVVASDANVLDAPRSYGSAELTLLNETGYTRTDRRLRRVYNMTMPVSNL